MTNEKILTKKFIFFAGKGGSGKTTCSASFALNLARKGFKILLVSTDPAHSLSHIFERKIGSKEIKIEENLWAIEIDPKKEARKYIKKIKESIKEVVSSVIVEEIKKQIDTAFLSPGVEESAIFDKFIEIMDKIGNPYDKIVFDTAPTGHTLRLFTFPELLESWIERLIERRLQVINLMKMASKVDESLRKKIERDPLIELLKKRREKFLLVRSYLQNKKNSCIIFVLDAERLSILETADAISLLKKHGIEVDGIIINRILTKINSKFFSKRKEIQKKNLDEIKTKFKEMIIGYIPLLESDIYGKESLEKIKFDKFK